MCTLQYQLIAAILAELAVGDFGSISGISNMIACLTSAMRRTSYQRESVTWLALALLQTGGKTFVDTAVELQLACITGLVSGDGSVSSSHDRVSMQSMLVDRGDRNALDVESGFDFSTETKSAFSIASLCIRASRSTKTKNKVAGCLLQWSLSLLCEDNTNAGHRTQQSRAASIPFILALNLVDSGEYRKLRTTLETEDAWDFPSILENM